MTSARAKKAPMYHTRNSPLAGQNATKASVPIANKHQCVACMQLCLIADGPGIPSILTGPPAAPTRYAPSPKALCDDAAIRQRARNLRRPPWAHSQREKCDGNWSLPFVKREQIHVACREKLGAKRFCLRHLKEPCQPRSQSRSTDAYPTV
jgi:hypothetical protein